MSSLLSIADRRARPIVALGPGLLAFAAACGDDEPASDTAASSTGELATSTSTGKICETDILLDVASFTYS